MARTLCFTVDCLLSHDGFENKWMSHISLDGGIGSIYIQREISEQIFKPISLCIGNELRVS